MVKYLLSFLLFTALSSASSLNREIENIIGKESFAAKKGLIFVLFKQRSHFFKGDRIDMQAVLQILKENNLLDLDFKKTENIQLSFATTGQKPLLFVKTIKDVLNAMGYNHTLTAKVMRDESGFLWKVIIRSAAVIDPLLLAKELQKRGAYITSIKRYNKDNWRYNISIDRAHLKAKTIPFNEKISLKKPLNPYWINVLGARSITIESKNGNIWHPYIVFYDESLQILDNYTKERKSYNASLKIPRHTKYVKISDLYTLENIKRGLKIHIRK